MTEFKLALVCDPGCEEYAALEVKELLSKDSEIKKGYVTLNANFNEAQKLCFYSQSANRILAVIDEGEYVEEEDFQNSEEAVSNFDYSLFYDENMTFKVKSEVEDCDTQSISMFIGEVLHDNNSWKVDLNNPDIKVVVKGFDGVYVVGIDLAGRALEKREYKIYHTRKTLRGTIGYGLVRFSGFNGKGSLLDPFCLDGSIAIETALFANKFAVNHYNQEFDLMRMPGGKKLKELDEKLIDEDYKIMAYTSQLKEVKNARSNAKIAGVEKKINVSKIDISWLDTKMEEKSVDFIVSYIPESGKSVSEKAATKIQEEFFWQAEYILADDGIIALLGDKIGEITTSAANKKFKLVEKKLVYMGKKDLWFMKFQKEKKIKSD